MLRIGLILSSPSPHQVELLDAVARRNDISAFIGYVKSHNPSRHWGRPIPDLPWENLPTGFLQMLRGDLHRWVAAQRADIWLLSSVYTDAATQLLARILRKRNEQFVFLGEPPRPHIGLRSRLQQHLMLSVVNRADAIIGTGNESARRYQQAARIEKPVISIPYVVDMSAQLSAPPVIPPAPGEPYRFVASAQLIHRKGLDVLIDACRRLPQSGWTLEIYGDGPLRRTLEARAASTDRPIYFRGLLPYERKDDVFRGKHCFVFSTRWDGWGMVLPEALAMGLPVITTDQAMSAHDFIRNGQNGQMGPAEDAEFIAAAMVNAMASVNSLTTQSIAAKESLMDYTPDKGADRLVGFLNQVVKKAA